MLWVPRSADKNPSDSGQYGVALRYFAHEFNNTEFGFYYMNYHSRVPMFTGVRGTPTSILTGSPLQAPICGVAALAALCHTGTASYFVEYPENIKLYGVSFNTAGPWGVALQGEYSYRPNQPIQLATAELILAALGLPNVITGSTQIPGAPAGATAAALVAPGTVITGYRVLTTGGPTQIAPMSVAGSPATVTGLSGGSLYSFTVMAQNTYGFGPASAATANVTPTGAALPGAPTGVVATVTGSGQVTVTWSAPSDGGSAITSYTVTPYTGGAAQSPTTVTGSPPATSTVINGLSNNQYYFQVTATNGVGTGPAGQSGVVTPTTLPGQPPFVRADVGNQQVTVTWQAPTDGGSPITGYTVTIAPAAARRAAGTSPPE